MSGLTSDRALSGTTISPVAMSNIEMRLLSSCQGSSNSYRTPRYRVSLELTLQSSWMKPAYCQRLAFWFSAGEAIELVVGRPNRKSAYGLPWPETPPLLYWLEKLMEPNRAEFWT